MRGWRIALDSSREDRGVQSAGRASAGCGERAVPCAEGGSTTLGSSAVQHPENTVESEPELVRLDPPALRHDERSGLVEDVVPWERPGLSLRSGPPEKPQPVKLQQSFPRSWVAREVKLVQLDGGEDPVLEQVDADPL